MSSLHGSFRQSLPSVGFRCPVLRIPKDSRPITLSAHVRHGVVTCAGAPAPKGDSTRSHCKRVRKECGRTAKPTFDTCRSSESVDVACLKNRSGDPQDTHIGYPRRSCRRSLLAIAILPVLWHGAIQLERILLSSQFWPMSSKSRRGLGQLSIGQSTLSG